MRRFKRNSKGARFVFVYIVRIMNYLINVILGTKDFVRFLICLVCFIDIFERQKHYYSTKNKNQLATSYRQKTTYSIQQHLYFSFSKVLLRNSFIHSTNQPATPFLYSLTKHSEARTILSLLPIYGFHPLNISQTSSQHQCLERPPNYTAYRLRWIIATIFWLPRLSRVRHRWGHISAITRPNHLPPPRHQAKFANVANRKLSISESTGRREASDQPHLLGLFEAHTYRRENYDTLCRGPENQRRANSNIWAHVYRITSALTGLIYWRAHTYKTQ